PLHTQQQQHTHKAMYERWNMYSMTFCLTQNTHTHTPTDTHTQRETYGPRHLKGNVNSSCIADPVWVCCAPLETKRISTDDSRRSGSVGARAGGTDLGLIFLQARAEI